MRLPVSVVKTFAHVQRNFDFLGTRFITGGQATLTYAASTDSDSVVVPHRLGRTPLAVVAISNGAPVFGKIPNCNTYGYDATNFVVNGVLNVAHTGTITIVWIAI